MGSMLFSAPIIASSVLDCHQILRKSCQESVRKGLKRPCRRDRGTAQEGDGVDALRRHQRARETVADSGGSRPRIRDDVAHHSDLISLGVPR
jgi:hypothetical protein